jgi:hypothetical protein
VIVKEPEPTLATINEALKVPPEIVHVEVPTTLPDNEQLVSLEEKPEPDTMTDDPTCAEVGLMLIVGEVVTNWKVAVAESPVGLPVAVTV